VRVSLIRAFSADTRAARDAATTAAPPSSSERVAGAATKHTFQAETKQLLNIVANSIYTDKHVFLRELLSNASDALEKARLRSLTARDDDAAPGAAPPPPLAISVTCDARARTLAVEDAGIGMTREELIDNLGTIARSGACGAALLLPRAPAASSRAPPAPHPPHLCTASRLARAQGVAARERGRRGAGRVARLVAGGERRVGLEHHRPVWRGFLRRVYGLRLGDGGVARRGRGGRPRVAVVVHGRRRL
jgi:hypothetical protein